MAKNISYATTYVNSFINTKIIALNRNMVFLMHSVAPYPPLISFIKDLNVPSPRAKEDPPPSTAPCIVIVALQLRRGREHKYQLERQGSDFAVRKILVFRSGAPQ